MDAADQIEAGMTREYWQTLADSFKDDATLGPGSRRVMAKHCRPTEAMIAQLESSIAQDTARNHFQLHRRIHGWFARGEMETATATESTSRVYDELFLSPDSDPWLGLAPADVYAALDENGLVR